MAIQFARARYISRSTGGSAVRSAAYNAREAIEAERTGAVYSFKSRGAPEHHEVLLPEDASKELQDCGALWNAAEAAEKRKDAQVAREIVLALPSDAGLTGEDRIALARSFILEHFVAHGLAVQLDVHSPHDPARDRQADDATANWHAHLLITTRRLEGDRFAAKKARDLNPSVRRATGKNFVAEGDAWGELWREHQNRYFQEHGLSVRVDATALHAGEHIGPVRMRRAGSAAAERAAVLRTANETAARDPVQVLAALTRNNATFTEGELDRYLAKHINGEAEHVAAKAVVLGHRDLVALHDRSSGEAVERWTTRDVRAQEIVALADGAVVAAGTNQGAIGRAAVASALASCSLRPDQKVAFEHAVAAGGLKLIEGRAGTGKSYTLQAVRDAHERAGLRVVGLAPTNAVAQDLGRDGFAEAGTVHAALFRLKNGRTAWDRRTAVIVDEAAMLDSRVIGELLAAARASGAKLILAGDDRQLASIERGGLFTELKERHGAAAIVEVTRQRDPWQRRAARDLAEGRFVAAVAAFDAHGAITWTEDDPGARAALVAAWKQDAAARPGSRFVFAYTNKDVDAFNLELRAVCRERGELSGPDVRIETAHGVLPFAVGDRVQFTDTLKAAQLYNGNVGTLTGMDAGTGTMRAVLDGGREVTWSTGTFDGFRHGYAGTIYKGQGKTLDHTYLYHTHHWRAAASYVALTRQRESAQVFVARDTARDAAQLARQMGRGEVKAASVAWATADEVAAAGMAARVRALQERVAALQATTAQQLQAVTERTGRQAVGVPVANLQERFQRGRAVRMLAEAVAASGHLAKRSAGVFERLAGFVEQAPKVLAQIAERTAERERQVERDRALQERIKAGIEGVRERHAEHLRQKAEAARQRAEAARDARARKLVETWEGLIHAHHAALPGLGTDPGLKGTREQLFRFASDLTSHPELVHALTTRGPEFGMEKRPNLARVLVDPSPERAVKAVLDWVEEPQRALLQAEAARRAELEEKLRPRTGHSPSPW